MLWCWPLYRGMLTNPLMFPEPVLSNAGLEYPLGLQCL